MSARDELAKTVFVAGSCGAEADAVADWNLLSERTLQPETRALSAQYRIADAILAAGYTKPRTITTAEELDALPDDSVVLDDMDGPLTKVGDWWHFPSGEMETWNVILPATILYEPTA